MGSHPAGASLMPVNLFLIWKIGFTGSASQRFVCNPGTWAFPWLEEHVLNI